MGNFRHHHRADTENSVPKSPAGQKPLRHLAVIIPERNDGHILIHRHDQPGQTGISQRMVFPAGDIIMKDKAMETAKLRLFMQFGLTSERWRSLGKFHIASHAGPEEIHFFHAMSVFAPNGGKPLPADSGVADYVDIFTLLDALSTGNIPDLAHAAALSLLLAGQEQWQPISAPTDKSQIITGQA